MSLSPRRQGTDCGQPAATCNLTRLHRAPGNEDINLEPGGGMDNVELVPVLDGFRCSLFRQVKLWRRKPTLQPHDILVLKISDEIDVEC